MPYRNHIQATVLEPFLTEAWPDGAHDINDALSLGTHPHTSIRRGEEVTIQTNTPNIAVSAGFGACSALVETATPHSVRLYHLDAAEHRLEHLLGYTGVPMILVCGSEAAILERPTPLPRRDDLQVALPETGNQHWSIAVFASRGLFAVVRKQPTKSVLWYELFQK